MVKFLKQNYEFIFCIFLLFIILALSISPQRYMDSTLYGLCVWAKIVLPSLFCFFIVTQLLQQNNYTQKLFNKTNKIFNKIYNVSGPSSYIFFMSIIAGYPMGAKLISEFYLTNQITQDDAKKIITFSSTSGPMFILGSLASFMLNNIYVGIIILISHILSSLSNGLLYRGKRLKISTNFSSTNLFKASNKQNINEIMLNSISSVLMVGGFISLSFTILELLNFIKIFYLIEKFFEILIPNSSNITSAILNGIFELTNGCLSLININIPLKILCILLTAIITFGGISIHLQSNIFLNKCNIKYRYFLKIKVTQTLLSIIISTFFSIILL